MISQFSLILISDQSALLWAQDSGPLMDYPSSPEQPLAPQLLVEFSHLASKSGVEEGRRRQNLVPYGSSILLRIWLPPLKQGHCSCQAALSAQLVCALLIKML